MAAAKKPEPEFPVESRTVNYLPAGVGVDPYAGNVPSLDPELAKIRDAEIKSNDVPINPALHEPTIDPELVKLRDEEIKRDAKRAESFASPVKKSTADAEKPVAKKSSK